MSIASYGVDVYQVVDNSCGPFIYKYIYIIGPARRRIIPAVCAVEALSADAVGGGSRHSAARVCHIDPEHSSPLQATEAFYQRDTTFRPVHIWFTVGFVIYLGLVNPRPSWSK